mgnify:CR=1 FL=1
MKRDCIWMGAVGGIVAIGLGTGAARDRGDAAPAAPSPVVEYVDTAALASPGGGVHRSPRPEQPATASTPAAARAITVRLGTFGPMRRIAASSLARSGSE